jgi:divalent metal cation (Fe/Co/Zn/Cd) transporter
MFENKRILKPKYHFKLEYDIKTDSENIQEILEKIQKNISKEFNENNLVAEVMPTITKLEV